MSNSGRIYNVFLKLPEVKLRSKLDRQNNCFVFTHVYFYITFIHVHWIFIMILGLIGDS